MKHSKYKQEQAQKDLGGLQKELEALRQKAVELKKGMLAHTQKDTNAYGILKRKIAVIATLMRSSSSTH
ncbi:MAG: hypothetical protein UZ21_OP11001000125 [Microgenomates bacterium OLB22]|nr:MAG: hypothetical protein UZ21_OP11001000125 [Microgenomates bacterium OLB22]